MEFRVEVHRFRSQGVCECGWRGKQRWLRGAAVADAYIHGAQAGHLPAGETVVILDDASVGA
ncbi:MAG TPA: hypothetical protein VFW21_07455 [Mycobacterium sp.]|nr:hypothetical protein [Mycobacterium sp.]